MRDERPGIKQRALQPCLGCGKGMMHKGGIAFYRVTLERYVIDLAAVRRQHGMEVMMGPAAALASIMGPDEDLAKQAYSHTFLLCDDCAIMRSEGIAVYDEAAGKRDD